MDDSDSDRNSDSYQVVIRIRDNGLGIQKTSLASFFDPSSPIKPEGKGKIGFRLSMGYQMSRKHGGILSKFSKPGQG